MGFEAFGARERRDVVTLERERLRGVLDERASGHEVVHAQRGGVACGATRREHVRGAGHVVPSGFWGTSADENGSGISYRVPLRNEFYRA